MFSHWGCLNRDNQPGPLAFNYNPAIHGSRNCANPNVIMHASFMLFPKFQLLSFLIFWALLFIFIFEMVSLCSSG